MNPRMINQMLLAAFISCLLMCSNLLSAQASESMQTLSSKQQNIVAIAAFTGKGDLANLKNALNEGLDAGLTVNEIKEVLVHTYAYAGFPRSLRGLQTFITVMDERKAKGITDTMGRDASPITDKRSKYERGKEILSELTGVKEEGPRTGYAAFAPEIEKFLKEHLFADIFERDVLTYQERELTTVAVLAAIGGVEPMARSHMNICLNVGITPEQLGDLLDIIEKNIGCNEANAIRDVLRQLLQSKGLPAIAATSSKQTEPAPLLIPKGVLIQNENFVGNAYLQRMMTDSDEFDAVVSDVVFEAGSYNHWHSHPGGQILIATSGKGYYQEKGKPVQVLNPGDLVAIPANVVHWHGATPDSGFAHLAINTKVHTGPAVWLEKLTEEEYNNLK